MRKFLRPLAIVALTCLNAASGAGQPAARREPPPPRRPAAAPRPATVPRPATAPRPTAAPRPATAPKPRPVTAPKPRPATAPKPRPKAQAARQRPPSSGDVEPDCYNAKTRSQFVDPDSRFGTVSLKGKLVDKRTQLRMLIPIKKGDPFDLCKLTFLRARLNRLGYFTEVTEERLGSKVNILVKISPLGAP